MCTLYVFRRLFVLFLFVCLTVLGYGLGYFGFMLGLFDLVLFSWDF